MYGAFTINNRRFRKQNQETAGTPPRINIATSSDNSSIKIYMLPMCHPSVAMQAIATVVAVALHQVTASGQDCVLPKCSDGSASG